MARSFVAKAARLKDNVEYTGASMGVFNPGRIAESVLADINWGELMGYCHRRFGPPNDGSDPYKEIAAWTVTTPVQDLFLVVIIRPQAARLLFGYLIAHDVERRLTKIKFDRDDERMLRWNAWCAAHKGTKPPVIYGDPDCPRGSAEHQQRVQLVEAWWDEFLRSDEANAPSGVDDSEFHRCNDALTAAIADLKRPVMVRDVPISALGRVDSMRGKVKPFQGAGAVTPPELLADPELWSDLLHAVSTLGRGKAGIRKAIDAIRRAG